MPVYLKHMRKHADKNAVLHCTNCKTDYSATPGDYFMVPEDEIFTCQDCDVPMILATKHTVYKRVR